jgi:plastocyanin
VYALSLTLAVTLAACGGGSQETSSSAPAASPTGMKVDPAKAGNVTGTVMVEGAVPKNLPIKMNADPNCLTAAPGTQLGESYVVGSDGKTLGNVFVYVKDGLGNYVFDTPTEPAKIDQKGCRYTPHVFGVRVGQPIEISNSDMTLHNIHAMPKTNSEFNTAQPLQNMKMTHTFDKKEVMVPFKCEVHGWMNASVGVLDHPYFAVTTDSGKFELKGLPAGTYTVEAWHEKLGTQTQSVTLADNETKDISITFTVPAGATD